VKEIKNMKIFYVFHDEKSIQILRNQAPECKLLYVGQKNLTRKYENVYVCKDMKDNIEQHPQFLSFTAWYAISKNKVDMDTEGNDESIAIFEYDCLPLSETSIKNLQENSKMYDVVGTSKINNSFYTDIDKSLLDKTIENLHLLVPPDLSWFSSTNFVMKRKFLDEFVELFWPYALDIINVLDRKNVAYYHERVFAAFLAKKMMDFQTTAFLCSEFKHFQLKSHFWGFNRREFQCTFVTYGDEKFRHSVSRISKEMKSVCENQLIYNETDIDDLFKLKSNIDWRSSRGGGYWLWKPYILSQALQSVETNESILYCDSGCCVENDLLLRKNIELFIQSDKEIYAFKMNNFDRSEVQWTSRTVLERFQVRSCDVNDGQIQATAFLLKNTPAVKSIVKKWLNVAINEPMLFTDDFSNEGKHRHDQSVWSCIIKQSDDRKRFFLAKDCIENEKNSFGLFKAHAHGNESCAISYALRYEDLRKAFSFSKKDLATHYEKHGKTEGRVYCNCFVNS